MTDAELTALTQQTTGVAYIFVGVACLLFFFLTPKKEGGPRRWQLYRDHFFRPRSVNRYDDGDPADYDEPRPAHDRARSLPSHPAGEVKREGSGEDSLFLQPGELVITEKALRDQGREAYEQGAIDVYAALLKGGYLDQHVKARRLGALKQTIHQLTGRRTGIFGATGGKALQRFNELVDAVPVERPQAPEQPPPAQLTPIAGRATPNERWAGEPAEEPAAAH